MFPFVCRICGGKKYYETSRALCQCAHCSVLFANPVMFSLDAEDSSERTEILKKIKKFEEEDRLR